MLEIMSESGPPTSTGATKSPKASEKVMMAPAMMPGTLIGNTMTHEVGHSLGLANPGSPNGSYHSNGKLPGRLMNAGSLRSFPERAEIGGGRPAVFCESEYAYLRGILRGAVGAPPNISRPSCLE